MGFPDIRVETWENPFWKLLQNPEHGVSEKTLLWELGIFGFDVSFAG